MKDQFKRGDKVKIIDTFYNRLKGTIHYWIKSRQWNWPPKRGTIVGYRQELVCWEIHFNTKTRHGTWFVSPERLEYCVEYED